MRQDKLTTKLQEALADAQSLAVGNDNQYIEPQHLLLALLGEPGIQGIVAKAGGNPAARETGAGLLPPPWLLRVVAVTAEPECGRPCCPRRCAHSTACGCSCGPRR